MKFLFLCHALNVGGLETYILRFAKWLLKKHPENQLELLCKSGQYGTYESDFRELGITLHSIPIGYFNPIPFLRFYKFLRSNHYDAICDFSGDFGALPMFAAYVSKTPQRLVFYRSARNAYTTTAFKRLYQFSLNHFVRAFCTRILSNSQDAFDYYFSGYPIAEDSRFQLIRNAIPVAEHLTCHQKVALRQELDILPGQKVALHVGSGRWEKNHPCMLEIARCAQDSGDNLCFCFAGPGVEKIHSATADQLGLKNIRFLGERRDVDRLLQIADVFLFPSLSEGQPNALLEAMISSVPFVASDIAPIRESLPPQWGNRWLFAPDVPEQGYALLKEHLEKNLSEETYFKSLVEWAQDVYNEDRCFERFLNCLRTL